MAYPMVPLKRCFHIINGSTPASDKDIYWDGPVTWVTPSDLSAGARAVSCSARTLSDAGYAACGTTKVPAGSLILSTRAPIGSIAIAAKELCTNQGCKSLVSRTGTDSRYFYYQLAAKTVELNSLGRGSTFLELSSTALGELEVYAPPLDTQTAIADYLDRKTAAIDALIAKKEQLIEELRKYLKAKTTEFVLRGLNENAPLKQSPVAAMGLIPAHWQVAKTARVLRYIKGAAVPREALATEGDESNRFLRTGDYWNVKGHEKDKAYVENTEGLSWKAEGEMIVCFDGFNSVAGKGTVGMARFEGEGYIDSMLCRVVAKNQLANSKFLEYANYSTCIENQIVASARGATAMHAGHAQYDMYLALPPLDEQVTIVGFLDELFSRVRPLIENTTRQTAELKKYRTAIISEAVSSFNPG